MRIHKLFIVCDGPRHFSRKAKSLRSLAVPAFQHNQGGKTVEGNIQLQRIKMFGIVSKPILLR